MSKAYGLRAVIIALCFLSMAHTVGGAEAEKDAFSFDYTFELNKDGTCHVTVMETITFNDHYFGNPEYEIEFQADQVDAGEPAMDYMWGAPSPGAGSGGQMVQAGGGKYNLIDYLHYLVWTQYNPHNFKATDYKTGERLDVAERISGDYKDFFIEIKEHRGTPEKGDTYTLIIEYDTENRAESVGSGRYAFSFYRKGFEEGGLNQFTVSVTLPPYYEYETSEISNPSKVRQSGTSARVIYQGEFTQDGVFEFRLEYHYPVSIFVEEGKSLFGRGDYAGALKKFDEAKKRYQNLGKRSELVEVNALISQCKAKETAYELFENAKVYFVNREFATAKQQFEDILSQYSDILEEDMLYECNHYIETCDKYVQAQELEQQAETDVQANMWESAVSNLQEAKNIYVELGEDDRVSWIEERITQIEKDWKEDAQESQLNIFAIGSVVIIGALIFAFFGYNAIKRPKPVETIDVGSLLESPDIPEEVKQFLEEKIGWRKVQAKPSRKEDVEIVEKLRKGRETLQKMLEDGLISEKEHHIAMEDIEKKIDFLVSQKSQQDMS